MRLHSALGVLLVGFILVYILVSSIVERTERVDTRRLIKSALPVSGRSSSVTEHREGYQTIVRGVRRYQTCHGQICRPQKYTFVLSRPGCLSRTVYTAACLGSCPSYTVPIARSKTSYTLSFSTCGRCRQVESMTRRWTFVLNCSGTDDVRHAYQRIFVESATKCSCQPC